MNDSVTILLFRAGDHCAPGDRVNPPQAVLHADTDGLAYSDNGLWVGRPLNVRALQVPGGSPAEVEPFAYDFRYFSKPQRQASHSAQARLQALIERSPSADGLVAESLVPMVFAVRKVDQVWFYHYVQQGEAGALFLRYHIASASSPLGWYELVACAEAGAARLRAAWPLLNDDCWYTKWRADIEMERKFTFGGIPDTWWLINELYDEVLQHRLVGFVPELDREFQVFDYESHIYEVSGDDAEAGYISYIPQANGRMTLKRKWFVENTEIRRETVTGDLDIPFTEIDAHVRTLTPATLRRMPPFRRKRFDVNFESLRTGNIYGVYFDICRTSAPDHAFSQCEVEYCRSRTFEPLRDVEQEFEAVAAYVHAFLRRKAVPFRHDTFSKLDFVRRAAGLSSLDGTAGASRQ
jgi:hypothetical protein